jgi:isopentenyl-diphosphate delta-isomerase
MSTQNIYQRKIDHLDLTEGKKVEMVVSNGLDKYRLVHNALPEIDFNKINLSTQFLGKKLKAPILVSSMTGGSAKAGLINKNLAGVCQELGIAMGVGSQRIIFDCGKTDILHKDNILDSFNIRKTAPDILLFANLGAVQFNNGFTYVQAKEAITKIRADALVLHLNPLQEAIQSEGNRNFSNLLQKIKQLAGQFEYPLIIKEVGNGISFGVARDLVKSGIRIIDTAGAGGTSWAYIEAKRSANLKLAQVFRDWGIPTSDSIIACKKAKATVIASGGIRNGVEVAKAIILGASMAGIGLPLLDLAANSKDGLRSYLEEIIMELKISMFCLGVDSIDKLKDNSSLILRDL